MIYKIRKILNGGAMGDNWKKIKEKSRKMSTKTEKLLIKKN